MTALALHRQTPGLSVSDPRGLTVRTVRYWRESGREQAQARSSRSGFDGAGRVVAEWDPRLVERANLTQVYSLGSKVLGSHSVDAGWRVSLFTQAAEQVQAWDARGNERQVEYDSLLRPVAVFEQAACVERHHYADASPHYAAHNQCGQLIRHDTPAGTQHFNEFGLTGAVLEQHQHFLQSLDMPDWPLPLDERDDLLEQAAGARSTLQFNPVGNVLEQTDAQGNRQRFNHTIDGRLREAWLQLKNATAAQRLVHDIHYNAQGQIEQQTAGNQVTSRFDYCPKDGRLNRLSAAGPSDEPLQDLHYVYDPVGNILSLEDKALPVRFFANQRIEPINRYTYDSLYQLIEATGWEAGSANRGPAHLEDPAAVANYRQTYRYDAGGNLLELIHHGPQQHGRVLTAAKHSNRCLPEVGGRPPTEAEIAEAFDASGNLLMLDRGRTLSWDARNQLSHVHMVERTLRLNDTERYVYGADGMRQRKVRTAQTNARTVISETCYLPGLETRTIDDEKLYVVTVQAGRTTVQVLHWEGAVPRQLANDQYRYNLNDHLGSCSLELDSEARIISRETYHPFGSTAFTERGDSSEQSYRTLRYSGKERDATGLYYYGLRYYMPRFQRWTNPDPLGVSDGLNVFAFLGGNPIGYRDAVGEKREPVNKDIHLIWVGESAEALAAHVSNINNTVEQASGYKVHLYLESGNEDAFANVLQDLKVHNVVYLREEKLFRKFKKSPVGAIYKDFRSGDPKNFAFAVDTLRPYLVRKKGGLYSDVDDQYLGAESEGHERLGDTTLYARPDEIITNSPVRVPWENRGSRNAVLINNSSFAAHAGNKTLKHIEKEMVVRYKEVVKSEEYTDGHGRIGAGILELETPERIKLMSSMVGPKVFSSIIREYDSEANDIVRQAILVESGGDVQGFNDRRNEKMPLRRFIKVGSANSWK